MNGPLTNPSLVLEEATHIAILSDLGEQIQRTVHKTTSFQMQHKFLNDLIGLLDLIVHLGLSTQVYTSLYQCLLFSFSMDQFKLLSF